jgi:hypothetical protein
MRLPSCLSSAIFRPMPTSKSLAVLVGTVLFAAVSGVGLPYATAAPSQIHHQTRATGSRSPYRSPELWATINVCNPKNAPDVVGVRGSMPGDGQAKDTMYMRFRLQYFEETTHKWAELGHGADSGLLPVGPASRVRQYGRSFTLAAPTRAIKLRGLVSFEWLRGKRVVYSTERVTSAGRKSVAGADPAGYSAATCLLS